MRVRAVFVGSCLMLWICADGTASADGKLARARREASSSSNDDSRSETHSHHHHHHRDRDCSRPFLEAVVCGIFGGCSCDDAHDEIVTVGVYVPDEAPPVGYARYPYASPLAPYLLDTEMQLASTSAELDAQLRREDAVGRPFAGQLTLDAGFGAGVAHSGIDARVLTPSPFEFGARTSLLWEPAARDYSLLGNAELGLRFAELPPLNARVVAGVLFFGHPGEMLVGAQAGLGLDLFLGRPWVLSLRATGGVLGNVFVPQARLQLGYLFGRSELFVGFELLQIGSVELSAPLVGMRIWL